MRTLLALMLLATTAEAAPVVVPPSPSAVTPAPIDLAVVPKPCAELAKQANVPRVAVAMSARISLARCIATERLRDKTDLIDAQDSIALVEDSVVASLALLDNAIATNDPKLVILAQHAKGELYAAMTARMLQTIPPLPVGATGEAAQLRDQRVQLLTTWLAPWRDKAHDAFTAVLATERAQPSVAKDAQCQRAIADSRQQLEHLPATVASAS